MKLFAAIKRLFVKEPPPPWPWPWPRVYGPGKPDADSHSTSNEAKRAWMCDPVSAIVRFPPEGVFYREERPSSTYVLNVREQWERDKESQAEPFEWWTRLGITKTCDWETVVGAYRLLRSTCGPYTPRENLWSLQRAYDEAEAHFKGNPP